MKAFIVKSAIVALLAVAVLSFCSIFMLIGEAGALWGILGMTALVSVGYGSYRLAERMYKEYLTDKY